MRVEVYVADDGEVIYERFQGDPEHVDFQVLRGGGPVWQPDLPTWRERAESVHLLTDTKRFHRMRLTFTACGETREDMAFERRALKALARLLARSDAMQR